VLKRLPLRAKLTLLFAGAIALVLLAVGTFVYFRVESDLDDSIDQALRTRADAIATVLPKTRLAPSRQRPGPLPDPLGQVLDTRGQLLAAGSSVESTPLLKPSELRQAAERAMFVQRGEGARLLALPETQDRRRLLIVVQASLEEREKTLESLARTLLIGGPLLLIALAVASYGIASAALRPVESMRQRATTISADEPGARLPLPPGRDELHRLGETLNAMLDRLESSFARERTFVADASHELRTPISIVKAELELALENEDLTDDARAALASASAETDRLSQLAEDLLVIASSDRGELAVEHAPVQANELLEHVAGRFRTRAELEGRKLLVDATLLTVQGDSLRLEQALGNLVDNALRHGQGTIRLSTSEQDNTVELHVSDAGPGFAQELLPRAFERFSRASTSRARGGAGLGLAIVQAIARAHGGDAHAANLGYGGADIWITLPAGKNANESA
jgi:two-component system OmpR family sensor kinase